MSAPGEPVDPGGRAGPDPGALRYPARPARRGSVRARTWWGKAWVRAIEEAAYAEEDLRKGRTLSRSGRIGAIGISARGFVAAVEDQDGMWAVSGQLPALGQQEVDAFCEAVEAESGRVGALLSGELPIDLVEHAEEAGVELLPYGGDLATSCSCDHWVDPCAHALAVLYQLAWLIDDDPFVLLHLVGLSRAALLARLDERTMADPARLRSPEDAADPADPGDVGDPADSGDPDVELAVDAAVRAARMLELTDAGEPIDHLL